MVCPSALGKVTRWGSGPHFCAFAGPMTQPSMTRNPTARHNCSGLLGEWVSTRLTLPGRLWRGAPFLFLVMRGFWFFLFLVAFHLTLGHDLILLIRLLRTQ